MSSDIARLRSSVSNDREEINRILNLLQQLNPKSERDSLKEYLVFSPYVRLRSTSVTTGAPNISETDTRNRETKHMIRKKPLTVKSYPLTHTTTGTISWQASGHKLGGNGIFSGTSYITVSNHTRLNPSTVSIALWIKPQSAASDAIIVKKDQQYELKLQASNQISWRVYSTAWKTALTYTYTPNTWVHIVATYQSGGQKLYVNGSLAASDSETGTLNTTTNELKIGGDGTNNLPANTALSWLSLIATQVNSSWVTDHYSKNILDTSGNSEILTIPFVGDASPKPDATSGLCRST